MFRASCAGQPTSLWFKDEVADLGEDTVFPETVYDVLRICSTCPVQRECVTYAYELEADAYDPWVTSTDADNDRYGVWGCPGRIRERFAGFEDRVERCLDWLRTLAMSPERRWLPPDETVRKDEAG